MTTPTEHADAIFRIYCKTENMTFVEVTRNYIAEIFGDQPLFARHELKAISGLIQWQLTAQPPKSKRHATRLRGILRKIDEALKVENNSSETLATNP